MKLQMLLSSIATGGLLLAVCGVAMAVGCPKGQILFDTVDEIVIDGESCIINAVTVEGKVIVKNSPVINISFSDIGGLLEIKNSESVAVINSDVYKGNVEITNNEGTDPVVIANNTVQSGDLIVKNNVEVVVQRNAVNGDIKCTNNGQQEAKGNRASGKINCKDQT